MTTDSLARLVNCVMILGAGADTTLHADLKCWAFSPPGGLVSETLLPALRDWCISVVCGKDAVPRMTTNNLARLMDEMVTALARARSAFLHVYSADSWRSLSLQEIPVSEAIVISS